MKRVLALILASSALVNLAIAQSVIYNIQPSDQKFLRYYHVQNEFDSAVTGYQFGEVQIGDVTTGWRRVNLVLMEDYIKLTGSSSTGVDVVLANSLKTGTFTYNGEDSIKFYRMAYVTPKGCNPNVGPTSGGHGTGSGPNGEWTVGDWWTTSSNAVLDRTDFVVEVVNAVTNTRVGTVDSVSIGPNPSTTFVPHGGTASHDLYVKVALPSMTNSTQYYLRISPARYGTTPYGLAAKQFGNWINLSYMFQRSSTGLNRRSQTHKDSLSTVYDAAVLTYLANEYSTYGDLPPTWDMPVSNATYTTIVDTYYDSVYTGGEWILRIKAPKIAIQPRAQHQEEPQTVDRSAVNWTISVKPNPSIAQDVQIEVANVVRAENVKMTVIDMLGNRVGVFSCAVNRPSTTITIPATSLPTSGVYHLIFESREGMPFLTKPSAIVRQ